MDKETILDHFDIPDDCELTLSDRAVLHGSPDEIVWARPLNARVVHTDLECFYLHGEIIPRTRREGMDVCDWCSGAYVPPHDDSDKGLVNPYVDGGDK